MQKVLFLIAKECDENYYGCAFKSLLPGKKIYWEPKTKEKWYFFFYLGSSNLKKEIAIFDITNESTQNSGFESKLILNKSWFAKVA